MPGQKDFEQLYSLYFKDIYLYLCSLTHNEHLAEDLTADTFLKAMGALGRFKGDCDIRVWLCQIAKNCYFSWYKRHKRQVPTPPEELPAEQLTDTILLPQMIEDKDTARRLHAFLHAMPDPYKEVFTLRVFCELPFAQIAALFGKTESWARVTYHRARRQLQDQIQSTEEAQDG